MRNKIKIKEEGCDCVVTIDGETRRVRHCNALLLANYISNVTEDNKDAFVTWFNK